MFKDQNRSSIGEIAVNNKESGSMMKINGQDKNRLGGVSLRNHRDFRFYLQHKEKPWKDCDKRKSSQDLTHFKRVSWSRG